jgi:hypothetical protein
MPCLQGTKRLKVQEHRWLMVVIEGQSGDGTIGGSGTLWHLDASPTESTKHVRYDIVFDLVFGKPGEHRQQPKHHSFDLG